MSGGTTKFYPCKSSVILSVISLIGLITLKYTCAAHSCCLFLKKIHTVVMMSSHHAYFELAFKYLVGCNYISHQVNLHNF